DLCPEQGKAPTLEEQKEYAKLIRAEADKYGMDINAYTIGANLFKKGEDAEKEIKRLCDQLDVAAILGAKVMRHDVCWAYGNEADARSFELMLPTIAANARKVTEYAATLGIRTCSENHGQIAQDSYRVEKLFNAVGHENYGLLVDMGNFACVDEDSAMAVSRLAPYAVHVHAKDWFVHEFDEDFATGYHTRGCRKLVGCAVGEGDIPVKRCIAILKKAGYDGYVSIEYEGPNDCIEGIKLGIENLKSFGVTTE
ncbi:MAG: sugar phosphate isomerase/epimerase, partial [Clostridia bacterium]|nr:sugar phosphate isomerase/epimerase [Clostridia bacterium]